MATMHFLSGADPYPIGNSHFVHVPYNNVGNATGDLITNQVQFMFHLITGAQGAVKSGQVRPIAVLAPQRSPVLPDVPTLEESGIAKADYLFWIGMLVSSKTPRDVVDKINQVTLKALQSPEVRERLTSLGADPLPMSPGQFDAISRDEMVSNAANIKAAGIKPK